MRKEKPQKEKGETKASVILKKLIDYIKPKARLGDLPRQVQEQYVVLCCICVLIGLLSIVLAVKQRNPSIFAGIPIALVFFLFVIIEYFAGFFYKSNQILEGYVISVPKAAFNAPGFAQRIAQDYNRLFLVIKTEEGVFYRIPCSGRSTSVSVGDKIRAYYEAGEIRQLSENSFRTPNASLVEILEEHPEENQKTTEC